MKLPRRPLNRTTAKQIIRLMSECLRRGVLDAANLDDDYECLAFLQKHRDKWDFGILGDEFEYNWKDWRFNLYKLCRRRSMTTFAENYLYEIKTPNYLYCPLIFAMQFYLDGIQEWLNYPNKELLSVYENSNVMSHWTGKTAVEKKMTRLTVFAEMQDIAFRYRNTAGDDAAPKWETMSDFCTAVFTLTSRHDGSFERRLKEEHGL